MGNINSIKKEKERMELNKRKQENEYENEKKRMELKDEALKRDAENEYANEKKRIELKDEAHKRDAENEKLKIANNKMEIDNERRKVEIKNNELKNKYNLEKEKANMEHQIKVSESIVQIQQSKQHSGKEIVLRYLETVNAIINENSNIYQKIEPLLNHVKDEKLPGSIRETLEESIKKTLRGYMSPMELLDYSKEQIKELHLNHDKEFIQILRTAAKQNVITEEETAYMLSDEASNVEE